MIQDPLPYNNMAKRITITSKKFIFVLVRIFFVLLVAIKKNISVVYKKPNSIPYFLSKITEDWIREKNQQITDDTNSHNDEQTSSKRIGEIVSTERRQFQNDTEI